MHRFFVDRICSVDETVRITGEDSRHISKVLRLREGDTIELCDGLGRDYEGVIRRINRNSVEVVIRRSYPSMG